MTPRSKSSLHPLGIALLHGSLGSPREFEPLQAALEAYGYLSHAAALPGHGDTPTMALEDVTVTDLLFSGQAAYDYLAERCAKVVLLGHSLGGLISLITAAQQPKQLAGVIALATPYEHAYFINNPIGLWSFLLTAPPPLVSQSLLYAPQSYTGFKTPTIYPWAVPHFNQRAKSMFEHVQTQLPNVSVPVLLAHSPLDLIVPFEEMTKIAHALTHAPEVETYTLSHCGHQIYPSSDAQSDCTARIIEFLNHLTP